jgi:CRISPR-associated endoribonuclease Cas6
MRIRLKLSPKPGEALLPSKYQHLVGSALYTLIDDRQQHDSRTTKLFCSSPLFWKERVLEGDKIRFRGPGYLVFCSADLDQINKLFSKRAIEIGGNLFDLHQPEFIEDPLFQEVMGWRIPPGCGAVTRTSRKHEKIFKEFTPNSDPEETAAQLCRNLRHRWKTLCQIMPKSAVLWSDEEDPLAWMESQVIRVSFPNPEKNRVVLGKIRDSVVKGWMGHFQVVAPIAIQRLIWNCGLGSKTALGFGYAEPAKVSL